MNVDDWNDAVSPGDFVWLDGCRYLRTFGRAFEAHGVPVVMIQDDGPKLTPLHRLSLSRVTSDDS